MSPSPSASGYLEAGTPAYRRANLAMFVGGFATFALLYGPQPLLPLLAREFAVSPAHASLSVAVGTAALALMLIPMSLLSDRYGRAPLMQLSLVGSALLSLLAPLAHSFEQLLMLRALLGIAIAGLPAAAMAWLGEEIAPRARGRAMGLYIAGNALGGMSGRFIAAVLTEWCNWQTAFLVLGVIGALAALLFWRSVPASRHFQARSLKPAALCADLAAILRDAGLARLILTAFLLMGTFVGLYNYLGFRLHAPPFNLGQTAVGAIFLLYVMGTWASAWSGRLVDRVGRRNVLWLMIVVMGAGLATTLASHLALVILGVALFTFGFFGAHTTASGWVGERAQARRALAAALYLTGYYLGASIPASLAGLAWDWGQWPGVALVLGGCVLMVLGLALQLRHLPSPSAPR
ncbi:MAG: MFS transporter [Azovibrio sp.]|nr:MFS transporter [Azovibrio sp.]